MVVRISNFSHTWGGEVAEGGGELDGNSVVEVVVWSRVVVWWRVVVWRKVMV